MEVVIAWCLGLLTTFQAYQDIGASAFGAFVTVLIRYERGYTRNAIWPCTLRPSFSDYCFLVVFLFFPRISSVSIWRTFLLFLSPSVALMVFELGR